MRKLSRKREMAINAFIAIVVKEDGLDAPPGKYTFEWGLRPAGPKVENTAFKGGILLGPATGICIRNNKFT